METKDQEFYIEEHENIKELLDKFDLNSVKRKTFLDVYQLHKPNINICSKIMFTFNIMYPSLESNLLPSSGHLPSNIHETLFLMLGGLSNPNSEEDECVYNNIVDAERFIKDLHNDLNWHLLINNAYNLTNDTWNYIIYQIHSFISFDRFIEAVQNKWAYIDWKLDINKMYHQLSIIWEQEYFEDEFFGQSTAFYESCTQNKEKTLNVLLHRFKYPNHPTYTLPTIKLNFSFQHYKSHFLKEIKQLNKMDLEDHYYITWCRFLEQITKTSIRRMLKTLTHNDFNHRPNATELLARYIKENPTFSKKIKLDDSVCVKDYGYSLNSTMNYRNIFTKEYIKNYLNESQVCNSYLFDNDFWALYNHMDSPDVFRYIIDNIFHKTILYKHDLDLRIINNLWNKFTSNKSLQGDKHYFYNGFNVILDIRKVLEQHFYSNVGENFEDDPYSIWACLLLEDIDYSYQFGLLMQELINTLSNNNIEIPEDWSFDTDASINQYIFSHHDLPLDWDQSFDRWDYIWISWSNIRTDIDQLIHNDGNHRVENILLEKIRDLMLRLIMESFAEDRCTNDPNDYVDVRSCDSLNAVLMMKEIDYNILQNTSQINKIISEYIEGYIVQHNLNREGILNLSASSILSDISTSNKIKLQIWVRDMFKNITDKFSMNNHLDTVILRNHIYHYVYHKMMAQQWSNCKMYFHNSKFDNRHNSSSYYKFTYVKHMDIPLPYNLLYVDDGYWSEDLFYLNCYKNTDLHTDELTIHKINVWSDILHHTIFDSNVTSSHITDFLWSMIDDLVPISDQSFYTINDYIGPHDNMMIHNVNWNVALRSRSLMNDIRYSFLYTQMLYHRYHNLFNDEDEISSWLDIARWVNHPICMLDLEPGQQMYMQRESEEPISWYDNLTFNEWYISQITYHMTWYFIDSWTMSRLNLGIHDHCPLINLNNQYLYSQCELERLWLFSDIDFWNMFLYDWRKIHDIFDRMLTLIQTTSNPNIQSFLWDVLYNSNHLLIRSAFRRNFLYSRIFALNPNEHTTILRNEDVERTTSSLQTIISNINFNNNFLSRLRFTAPIGTSEVLIEFVRILNDANLIFVVYNEADTASSNVAPPIINLFNWRFVRTLASIADRYNINVRSNGSIFNVNNPNNITRIHQWLNVEISEWNVQQDDAEISEGSVQEDDVALVNEENTLRSNISNTLFSAQDTIIGRIIRNDAPCAFGSIFCIYSQLVRLIKGCVSYNSKIDVDGMFKWWDKNL